VYKVGGRYRRRGLGDLRRLADGRGWAVWLLRQHLEELAHGVSDVPEEASTQGGAGGLLRVAGDLEYLGALLDDGTGT